MSCKEYNVYGLRRSGHHAVLTWIIGLTKNTSVHYDAYVEQNSLVKIPEKNTHHFDNGKEKYITEIKNKEITSVFYNLEDTFIYPFPFKELECQIKRNIIVYRDPYNLLASRCKMFNELEKYPEYIHATYLNHLYFPEKDNIIIKINYNSWFSNIEYRKQLANKLDLEFNDNNLNILSVSGSSFTKQEYIDRGQQMDILKRYLEFVKEPFYIKLFENYPILEKIGNEFFNMKKPF